MSEYFSGVTFAEQTVLAADDAILHRAILPDGALSGCEFSYSGSALTMSAGAFLLCGRQVRHKAAQSWTLAGASSGYARVVLSADLSKASSEDTFEQVGASVEYAATLDNFSRLTQTDINGPGTIYQVEACVVSLGAGGITGIVRAFPQLSGGVFAPGGYGLGQDTPAEIGSLAALDGLTQSGFFKLNVPDNNAAISGCNVSKASVFVKAYDAANTAQELTVIGSGIRIVRTRTAGSWGPWSFENPPMDLAQEYRTTELWGGTPVFTKRIAYGAGSFSAQNVWLPHNISGLAVCVSAAAIWKRSDVSPDGWRQLPSSDYSSGNWDGHIEYVDAQQIKFRLGSELQYRVKLSQEPVYVTLKYTKQ